MDFVPKINLEKKDGDQIIQTKAIEEILPFLEKIIFQLEDKIKNHEYSSVIGEDASGRIPSLILYKAIKEIYKKDQKDINITFIAGSSHLDVMDHGKEDKALKRESMTEYLEKNLPKESKTLIVTDTINTGSSLRFMSQVLKNLGIEYDIISLSVLNTSTEEKFDRLEKYLGSEVLYATEKEIPNIVQNYSLAGVRKHPKDLFAKKFEFPTEEHRKKFLQGRKDVDLAAHKLAEYYANL